MPESIQYQWWYSSRISRQAEHHRAAYVCLAHREANHISPFMMFFLDKRV
jgi:hypothetical protein